MEGVGRPPLDADPPGHVTCDACWEANPPPHPYPQRIERMTHACDNITLPQTSFVGHKNHTKLGGVSAYARHGRTRDPGESPTFNDDWLFYLVSETKNIVSTLTVAVFTHLFLFLCEKTHMYLNANYKLFKVKGYPNMKHRYSHFFLPKDLSGKVFLYNDNYYIWHMYLGRKTYTTLILCFPYYDRHIKPAGSCHLSTCSTYRTYFTHFHVAYFPQILHETVYYEQKWLRWVITTGIPMRSPHKHSLYATVMIFYIVCKKLGASRIENALCCVSIFYDCLAWFTILG